MRVAALQTDIAWEDPPANFEALEEPLREAAACGAGLVVLPEMYACGFSMDTQKVAEGPDGPSTAFLAERARALGVWIAGSVPVREPGAERPHNTLVLAGPDGTVDRYRKRHLFTYHGEHEHYAPGDALLVREVGDVRLAFFICYDLRFADAFWRLAPEVDGFVVVANWPAARREHWKVLLRARAVENQAYVVAVNRVGGAGTETIPSYAGDSAIVDPAGAVLVEASTAPTMLLADLDPEHVARTRRAFPVLEDRDTESGPIS